VQTTLLGLAIGLILALLAALVGPHFVNWNDHRAFFEAEAARLAGVPVRVVGDIDAALLPFPSVTLRGVVVGPEGTAGKLRARSLRVEFGLGPLLRGNLRAVEVRLVAPQFAIGLDTQGRIDWPAPMLSIETLSIDRLRIEDGRATLADAASGTQLVLGQLWFSGEVRSLTGPFRGRGEFVAGHNLYGYEISTSSQGPDGMRVKLGLKVEDRPLAVEADGVLAFEGSSPRFDGALALSRPAGAVLASGKAVAYEPWRLAGKIKAGAASAALDDVSFQYGPDERGAALVGAGVFEFGKQPKLRLKLSARQIDLDRLLATPQTPRRLPASAIQGFGELLGSALRPSWPLNLSVAVDSIVVGGGTLQAVACDLRSDGESWALDKLEFRAPGFTQVAVHGRLYPAGRGVGLAGGTNIDSNDPKNLAAWLAGRPPIAPQNKPWHASGDITLGADQIAVERLRTEFGRGAVEGDVIYRWGDGDRPARLDAKLRAEELDLDAALGFGVSSLTGLDLVPPREVSLAVEVGRARIATLEARDVTARLRLDESGVAIERLSISDFGNAGIEARGRIETKGNYGGNISLDLNARDLDGLVALTERIEPLLAEPLQRLAGRDRTAKLHAEVSLASGAAERTDGRLVVTGQIGAVRVKVAANANGRREAFKATNLRALADTDFHLDGELEADEPAALLALVGLERVPAADDRRLARLSLAAHGAPGRDLKFEGKFDAGPVDVGGKGTFRLVPDQPAVVELDQIAGTIGGRKMKARLGLRLGEAPRLDGSIETEALDAGATIAAIVGIPVRSNGADRAGWSSDPLAWDAAGLTGRIAFQAERAMFAPTLVARQLRGVARFGRSELVFEDVAGELAKGRFEGRLAFENSDNGLAARARIGLREAEAGEIFRTAQGTAIAGRLTVQSEVEAAGRSPAAFVGSLAGYGTVTLERGEIAGLNPGVFDTVRRAVELGVPIDGSRIREFVTGVLDGARVPLARATTSVRINAGHAQFGDIAIQAGGADVQAVAGIDLTNATLDALLTLTGPSATALPDRMRPAVLVALKGPALAPHRTVDTSLLTRWLTMLTVEQQSKQLDVMERAARERAERERAERDRMERERAAREQAERERAERERALSKPEEPAARQSPASLPAGGETASVAGDAPTTAQTNPAAETKPAAVPPTTVQAPALPAPVEVPSAPEPRAMPRTEQTAPPRSGSRPPALVGAQH
jgi:large subunit ribosomal protein L24